MKLPSLLLSYCLLLFLYSCSGDVRTYSEVVTPEVKVALFAVQVEGNPVQAKVTFSIAEGWHIYGPKPQKNGRPTTVSFSKEGSQFAEIEWPATKVFDEGMSGQSDGYQGQFDVLVSMISQNDAKKALRAKVSWAACKDICVPGEAELEVN